MKKNLSNNKKFILVATIFVSLLSFVNSSYCAYRGALEKDPRVLFLAKNNENTDKDLTNDENIIKKQGFIIRIPNGMREEATDFPLLVAKILPNRAPFPTITITKEPMHGEQKKTTQELERDLKTTYEGLKYIVKSSSFSGNQTIKPNINSMLFIIQFTNGNSDFVSLVNIFTYDDKIHYITTVNPLNKDSNLANAITFQKKFINYISLETDDQKEGKRQLTKFDTEKLNIRNILIICAAFLAFFLMARGKRK